MSLRNTTNVQSTNSVISLAHRWDHFLARWGVNRAGHRVEPGLYSLGNPSPDSPVLVTANYTLSFDALRAALSERECYILVLDTRGINVWCAAGKGTFGTDELVQRIKETGLSEKVTHRTLILPQLGAPGVAAHEVKKQSGFKVNWGPVRADDLPRFLDEQRATPEMRRVHFPLPDRLVLIPVEFAHVYWPMVIAAVVLFFTSGMTASVSVTASILAGTVFFPLLLPAIPTRDFSSKGFILGSAVAIIPISSLLIARPEIRLMDKLGWSLSYALLLPAITAFFALNFTGSTTFTSKSGVKREMSAYIPVMAGMFGIGLILFIIFSIRGGS